MVSAGKVIDIKAGEPNLRIGEICRRTGVTVGAELLEQAGLPCRATGCVPSVPRGRLPADLLALAKTLKAWLWLGPPDRHIKSTRKVNMSINKVILIGNVGKDPELRYNPAASPGAHFLHRHHPQSGRPR